MAEPDFDKTVFVIMPFGEEGTKDREQNDDTYENIIKMGVESSGLDITCIRSDDICLPGGVMEDVITYTVKSKYVIADLSDRNANVFYELGIRDSFDGRTILLCKRGQKLPFDLKDMRTVFYSKELVKESSDAIDKIRANLTNMESVETPIQSPVRRVLGADRHPDQLGSPTVAPQTHSGEIVSARKFNPRMRKRLCLDLQHQGFQPCARDEFPSEFQYWGEGTFGYPSSSDHVVAVYFTTAGFNTAWSDYQVDLLRLIGNASRGGNVKRLRVIFAISAELDNLRERLIELCKLVVKNHSTGIVIQNDICKEEQIQGEDSFHSMFDPMELSFDFFDLYAARELEERLGIKR